MRSARCASCSPRRGCRGPWPGATPPAAAQSSRRAQGRKQFQRCPGSLVSESSTAAATAGLAHEHHVVVVIIAPRGGLGVRLCSPTARRRHRASDGVIRVAVVVAQHDRALRVLVVAAAALALAARAAAVGGGAASARAGRRRGAAAAHGHRLVVVGQRSSFALAAREGRHVSRGPAHTLRSQRQRKTIGGYYSPGSVPLTPPRRPRIYDTDGSQDRRSARWRMRSSVRTGRAKCASGESRREGWISRTRSSPTKPE